MRFYILIILALFATQAFADDWQSPKTPAPSTVKTILKHREDAKDKNAWDSTFCDGVKARILMEGDKLDCPDITITIRFTDLEKDIKCPKEK